MLRRPSQYPYAVFMGGQLDSQHTSIWAAKARAHSQGATEPDIRVWDSARSAYVAPADHPAYQVRS